MNKFKTGDDVVITTGKDKGKSGKLLRFAKNGRVIVEGLNMVKKHVRANPNAGEKGGIIDKEASIHLSNVALYNSATKKAGKVGIKVLDEEGTKRKVRYFKSNGEVVDI